MKKTLLCFLVLTGVMTTWTAQAQTPASPADIARQRRESVDLLRELRKKDATAPALYPDEDSDVGPQSILRVKPRHDWFQALLDTQLSYTDNLLFQEGGKPESASVFVNTAQLALTPPAWGTHDTTWFPRVGYRHQWFNYGLFEGDHVKNNFDFEAQTAFGDVACRFHDWQFKLGLEWTRLLGVNFQEFYREYAPQLSVQRVLRVNERSAFVMGYLGSYRLTDVDPTPGFNDRDRLDRWDHVLIASYNRSITSRLVVQPFYRFQFTDYAHLHREDLLHSFGGSVAWFFTDNLFARGYVSYDLKQSNDPLVPEYRKLDTGAGLSFGFKF